MDAQTAPYDIRSEGYCLQESKFNDTFKTKLYSATEFAGLTYKVVCVYNSILREFFYFGTELY
jgi:hypothetical protein